MEVKMEEPVSNLTREIDIKYELDSLDNVNNNIDIIKGEQVPNTLEYPWPLFK